MDQIKTLDNLMSPSLDTLLRHPVFRNFYNKETLIGALQQFIDFSKQRVERTRSQPLINAYDVLTGIAQSLLDVRRHEQIDYDPIRPDSTTRVDPESGKGYVDVGGGLEVEGGYSIPINAEGENPIKNHIYHH